MKSLRRLLVICLVVYVSGVVVMPSHAGGATITVDVIADENDADDDCSLREAIAAANTDTVVSGCEEGQGPDRIQLISGTFLLHLGPLEITTNMTIEGVGRTRTSIERSETAGNNPIFDSNPPTAFTLTDLTVANGEGTLGGGINQGTGRLVMRRVVVRDNNAAEGAGVWTDGVLDIAQSVFKGNVSTGSGGGIYSAGTGSSTISGTTFSGNRARDGGGIFVLSGTALLARSAFLSNGVTHWGGGIYASSDSLVTVENSTLSSNKASGPDDGFPKGGGLYNAGGTTLSNVTITNNRAEVDSSGIVSDGYAFTNMTIRNSIVSGNQNFAATPGEDNCFFAADPEVEDYNLEDGNSCAFTDLPAADPRLGRLGLYGGPTKTYPLEPSSPALDAGSPGTQATGTDCRPTDQRSVSRPQDGPDGNRRPRCDVGAFELRMIKEAVNVTLDLDRHLKADGRVIVPGGFNDCRKRVRVFVQHKEPNGWDTVADPRTDRRGRYSTSLPDDAGVYRAQTKAKEIAKGDIHKCRADTSSKEEHRHG